MLYSINAISDLQISNFRLVASRKSQDWASAIEKCYCKICFKFQVSGIQSVSANFRGRLPAINCGVIGGFQSGVQEIVNCQLSIIN